jgi:molecular chaperone DnaJ
MKDYYQILGVTKSASPDEIKKAFHKLAHKYHPDKKGGDEAKFKEVNEAYQVLSDSQKRAQYDRFGQSDFGGAPGGGAWDFTNFAGAGGEGFAFDFGDLFSDFFGGRQGAGGRKQKRGRDISVDVQLPFAEAIFGATREILITKIGYCPVCAGSGAKPGTAQKTCVTCNGRGEINETRQSFLGAISTRRECSACHGRGQVPETPCANCTGRGVVRQTEEVKVVIPAGVSDGEIIRLTGKGEALAGGAAGDLYVRLHVERHATLRREGDNLVMDLPVKLTDALLGAEYPVTTIDGELKVKIPEGISYGEVLRVKGRGVPNRAGKRGDLYLRVLVKTPAKLSKRTKQLVEDLKKEGL